MLETPIIVVLVLLAIVAVLWWVYRSPRRIGSPGGAGWKLLTFLCCAFAGWSLVFASSLLIAVVAWLLAWAVAMAMRMSFNRRRA